MSRASSKVQDPPDIPHLRIPHRSSRAISEVLQASNGLVICSKLAQLSSVSAQQCKCHLLIYEEPAFPIRPKFHPFLLGVAELQLKRVEVSFFLTSKPSYPFSLVTGRSLPTSLYDTTWHITYE